MENLDCCWGKELIGLFFWIYSKRNQTTTQWRIYMENNMKNKELKWIDQTKRLRKQKNITSTKMLLAPHDVAPMWSL